MDNPTRAKHHCAPVLVVSALVVMAAVAMGETFELAVPAGVLPPEVPEENPVTQAKIGLGKKLFFDRRISTDGTVACATCHDPRHAFADGRGGKTSAGVGGALETRNAPTACLDPTAMIPVRPEQSCDSTGMEGDEKGRA